MKNEELAARVEEIIENLEESKKSLKELKKDTSDYKEIKIADTYVQRAKKALDLLYERLVKKRE